MSAAVEFTVACPECGATASSGTTLLGDNVPSKAFIVIDLDGLAGLTFECGDPNCQKMLYGKEYEVFV